MADWFRKLFGRKEATEPVVQIGDLQLVPSSVTTDRAEAAMPGTGKLEPLIALTPPIIDTDLLPPAFDKDELRDYGPDPVAEAVLSIPASKPFDCAEIAKLLYAAVPDGQKHPMHYVVTPEGQTTYLSSADAPKTGKALILGWSFWPGAEYTPDIIEEQAAYLSDALRCRPEGFQITAVEMDDVHNRYSAANRIIELTPSEVTICANLPDDQAMNGRAVWNTLHRIGFSWGDMDCFQWIDATETTDYLIWVEADDKQIGYVLPEEVSAGRQDFVTVRFSVNLARTPSPVHVVGEMIKAASCFSEQTGAILSAFVDQNPVDTSDALQDAAQNVTDQLLALGTKPGSQSVCRLR